MKGHIWQTCNWLLAGPDKAEIRHQRMIEFATEGLRFYDLKRWGLLQREITNSDKVGKQFFVPNKHDYFPIPQSEIESNPNMVQNPNW